MTTNRERVKRMIAMQDRLKGRGNVFSLVQRAGHIDPISHERDFPFAKRNGLNLVQNQSITLTIGETSSKDVRVEKAILEDLFGQIECLLAASKRCENTDGALKDEIAELATVYDMITGKI